MNGAGLRYEVCVAIETNNIVWISGPFAPGRGGFPDIKIFRTAGLKHLLASYNERAIADKGYGGEPAVILKKGEGTEAERKRATYARARQETINGRMKNWNILKNKFRHNDGHDVAKHGIVFRAVAVLTQLTIQTEEPLFNV